MEISGIVLSQTLTMALYMLMGYLLFRSKKITADGSKSLANILIWLVIPCVVVGSFCVEPSVERTLQMIICTALSALALAIAMLLSRVIFPKYPVDNFAAAFSNAGFMGIPLVRACYGDDAVFFLVGFVALLNLLQWTYGASLLSNGKAKMGIKQILLNPIFISLFLGLFLFFTGFGIKLPSVVQNTIKGVSGLNGPVAMLVLGVYLAQINPKSVLVNYRLFILSAVRLVVIPLVTLLVLWALPVDTRIRLTILTAAAAPVGSNVAVYAQIYGGDYPYACQTVAMSTVLSVITMPLILALSGILL